MSKRTNTRKVPMTDTSDLAVMEAPAPVAQPETMADAEEFFKASVTPEFVKEVKARKPSSAERGEDGKIRRSGKNLSGNVPFRLL